MSIHNPSELISNNSFNQETANNPKSIDNNYNFRNKLRNAFVGIGSIGLVTSNLVPEIKLSNSGLSASYENIANATVTVDGKKIIVSPDDIKNGLAFVDQNYETHKPTPDFLAKYKNISDAGINQLIKTLVSEQKIQRISALVQPPIEPKDYKDVADLTQEIVGQLNSPKKTFNIDSKVVGNRPKDSTPPTVAGETKEPVNTTGKVIDTSPTGSFTKPAESPSPAPTPEVAETPVQVEPKPSEIAIKVQKNDPLETAAKGGLAGLALFTLGTLGYLGFRRLKEDDYEENKGYDFENDMPYQPNRFERIKNFLQRKKPPTGPTREDFEDMDDEEFNDYCEREKKNTFGSNADCKFKLNWIYEKSGIKFSQKEMRELNSILLNTDLNMYNKPIELIMHIKRELDYTDIEIESEDLITIAEIMLDRNF